MEIRGTEVLFEVDTGAALTVVNEKTFKNITANIEFSPSKVWFKTFRGNSPCNR